MPGTIAASRACGSGTKTRSMPRAAAAITIGSTPGTDRRPPVRVSSPMKTVSASTLPGQAAVGREHRHRDREVEVGAALQQVGRREQDRDPLRRGPAELAVDDRHPAAVPSLVQRGVGPADQGGADLAGRDVALHVDQVAERSLQRDRVGGGAGHQTTPRTWSIVDRPRRGRITQTRSIRRSGGLHAVGLLPAHPQLDQPRHLGRRDRLVRVPAIDAAAGLHLAHDEHATVAQHEIDLARLAAPVAVEQDHALLGTRCCAASASPYAPSARLVAAVVEPVIC